MKKRIFAVICAVVMVFSLVSCSGGETDVASDVQMNKEGLPIVNEPVTLKVAVQKAPHLIDFKDMPLLQQLEEKVNKHNNIIERTFILEVKMTECQHDIKDLKAYHKPT